MSVISFIRRRVTSKIHPVFKRVLLPLGIVVIVLNVLTWTDDSTELPTPGVLPGEALDPLSKPRLRHPHDKRPDNAFEKVLKEASNVEEMQEHLASAVAPKPSIAENGNKEYHQKKNIDTKKPMDKVKDIKKKTTKEKDESASDGWSMAKAKIPGKEKVKFQGHAITEQTVTLTVMSSSDKVFMSLNKREIYRGLEDRGMHVVVLNPHTGKVMATRVFDTFFNGTEQEMVSFLDNLQDGRIAVFAIRDEAASGLTWKGRGKLKQLGGRFAEKLAFRDMWILVTKIGGLKLAESYSNVAVEDTSYEWGGPLFLRTDFDLDDTADRCKWGDGYQEEVRQKFCQRFEGYGDMCRCSVENFNDIFFKSDSKVEKELLRNPMHKDLAVAVIASDRPDYLYKTLKSLREAPGLMSGKIVVFTETENREVAALVKLFSVQYVVTGSSSRANVTAVQRIRDKVQYIFRSMMGASFPEDKMPAGLAELPPVPVTSCSHLVILEDDIQVSVDFFKYLYAVSPVMNRDSTAIGIATFNYNSYINVANSLTSSYRTNRMHTLALMLPASTVHQHIIPHWPSLSSNNEWYHGLEAAMELNPKLAFILPEVSRSKHFGYKGIKIKGSLQHAFFADHKISLTTSYTIPEEDVYRLEHDAYNNLEIEVVKKSTPISFNFCKYSVIFGQEPLVVFIQYSGDRNADEHLIATLKCLGAWHLYGEGSWRDTWHFHYHGHPMTIVAVPVSPLSHLMPADYKFTDMTGPENVKASP